MPDIDVESRARMVEGLMDGVLSLQKRVRELEEGAVLKKDLDAENKNVEDRLALFAINTMSKKEYGKASEAMRKYYEAKIIAAMKEMYNTYNADTLSVLDLYVAWGQVCRLHTFLA